MDTIVYKIEDADIWAEALAEGTYLGSALDLADGFIHLSAAAQVRETATKWFAGRANLVIGVIDLATLADEVKWEASRGGALFPHLYGPLPAASVVDTWAMPLDHDGNFVFPAQLPEV